MNSLSLKRLRPTSLVLFALGMVAFVMSIGFERDTARGVAALVAFGSLCFFTFTEAFLYRPPERALFSIWAARVFFVPNLLVVISLAVQFMQVLA